MADEPTGVIPEDGPARSDLFARIQEIQQGVQRGLTASEVDQSVRAAVAAMLPGAVADAVARSLPDVVVDTLAGSLPTIVADAVDASVERAVARTPGGSTVEDTLAPRLAALEDAIDGIGDRLESVTRDGTSATTGALDDVRTRLSTLTEELGSGHGADATRAEIDALRVDMANALEYVRETVTARLDDELGSVREAITEVAGAVDRVDVGGADLSGLEARLDGSSSSLEALHGRLDLLDGLQQRLDGLAAVPGRLDVLDTLEQRLDGLVAVPGRLDVLDGLRERLDGLVAVPGRLDVLDGLRERLDGLAGVPGRLEAIDAALATVPGDRLDALQDRLDLVGADVTRLDPTLVLARLEERLDAVRSAVTEQAAGTALQLNDAADRQGALISRSVSEAVSESVSAAVSAAVTEAVTEGVTEGVTDAVVTALTAQVGELVVPQLLRQLPESVVEPTATRVAAVVRDELAGVGSDAPLLTDLVVRVEALGRALEGVATVEHVDAVGASVSALGNPGSALEQEVDALRVDLANALDFLRDNVESRSADTTNAVLAELGELRTDQATAAAESIGLLAGLADLRSAPAEIDPAVLRAVADEQAALAHAFGELRADVATSSTESLSMLALLSELVESRGAEPEPVDLSAVMAPYAALLEDLRAGQVDLAERVSVPTDAADLTPQLDALLAANASTARAVEELRADLATTGAESLTSLAGLDERVASWGDPAGQETSARLAELVDAHAATARQLAELVEAHGTTGAQVLDLSVSHGELVAQLGAVGEVAAGQGELIDRVTELQQRDPAEVAALLRADLDLLAARSAVADERLEDVRLRSAELLLSASTLLAGLDRQGAALDALAAQLGDQGGLAGVVGEVGSVGTRVDVLAALVEAAGAADEGDRGQLADAAEQLAAIRVEVAQVTDRVQDQVRESAATLEGASLDALEQVRVDTDAAVQQLRLEVGAARDALDDHARTLQSGVGTATRAAADQALADIRQAVDAEVVQLGAARTDMAEIGLRVQAAGRLLVAYLGERDQQLEEVRDRVTVELLQDVVDGLSRKDKTRAVEQTRGVLARRREARDADRYRQQLSGQPRTDLPGGGDEAALVALLDEDPPPPPPPPAVPIPATRPFAATVPVRAARPPAAGPVPAAVAPPADVAARTPPARVQPAEAPPARAVPARAVPARAVPARAVPAGPAAKTVPARAVPARAVPATPVPARGVPARAAVRAPVKAAPVKAAPVKAAPVKAAPAKAAAAAKAVPRTVGTTARGPAKAAAPAARKAAAKVPTVPTVGRAAKTVAKKAPAAAAAKVPPTRAAAPPAVPGKAGRAAAKQAPGAVRPTRGR